MTVTEEILEQEGYWAPRQLPNGQWIGVRQQMYTWSLNIGLDETGYEYRYCYEKFSEAMRDALTWNGDGDPPGMWIKEKGRDDRMNPRWLEAAKAEIHFGRGTDEDAKT